MKKIFPLRTIIALFQLGLLRKYAALFASRPLTRKEEYHSNYHHQRSADIGESLVCGKNVERTSLMTNTHSTPVCIKLQDYKM